MHWCKTVCVCVCVLVYICVCVCKPIEYMCVCCTYIQRVCVCAQVRVLACVRIIPFSLWKGIYSMQSVFLPFLMSAKESKTRPSIFRDIIHPLNHRMDRTEGRTPLLPYDYSVLLTACSHGAEIRGNNFDGKNVGLLIYYSQKQSLNQYACTPVGSWNLTHLLPSIINHLQSCVAFWFDISKISVNYRSCKSGLIF